MTQVDSTLLVRIATRPFSSLAPLAAAGDASVEILRAWAADPEVRTMLRLAGREVLRASARLAEDPTRWRAKHRRIAITLLRTVVRAATKTTPLGVSCTTALGGFGPALELTGDARPDRLRVLLLRGEALRLVADVESTDPAVRADRPVRLNPTLQAEGDFREFWRPAVRADQDALERRVRIRSTPLLEAVIERCLETSPPTRDELAAWAEEQAKGGAAWLERLFTAGLLGPESAIPHLEERPVRQVAARMTAGSARGALAGLEDAVDAVARAKDASARLDAIEQVDGAWARARAAVPGEAAGDAPECAVQVDAAAPLRAVLPDEVRGEIVRVLERYARWFAALYPARLLLAPYVARFLRVHPPDRAVPLAACYHGVFDDLGRPTRGSFPDLRAFGESAEARRAEAAHARFAAFRARRLDARAPLDLTDEDWDELAGDTQAPRFACGLLFQFDADSGRIAWNGIYGPGLASARLASLHAAGTLAAQVRAGWRWIAGGEGVVAEIPYSHAGRTANAGLRPAVFEHEIELPGETPTPGAIPIPIRDLEVRYDSARGRFEIVAQALDRIVVPVLTSSLSPEGFIAFLAAVGMQDTQPLAWFSEFDAARPGALPEITSGRTILFRRRFRLPADEVRATFGGEDIGAAVAAWRVTSAAPRHVFVSDDVDPKPRYVDLEAHAFAPELRALAKAGRAVTLREMWPVPPDTPGPRGHAVEFLAQVRGAGA